MASVAQVVSELAHSLGKPLDSETREHLKLLVFQTRNEVIRRSYENHSYVDKVLTQRYKVSLTSVNDGEITMPEGFEDDVVKIKRTTQQVLKPVRLTNNLPFSRVSSVGFSTSREFPFIKETTARFRGAVPGLCGMPCYDYINGYIYLFPTDGNALTLSNIIIEGAFEKPTPIDVENGIVDSFDEMLDDYEFLISEDMLGSIKELIIKRDFVLTATSK